MNEHLKVAELLCTRLCHDLTGPIGAVNNGAEFLGEEGFNMQGQALELITSSAQSAVARLQFYRVAYGRVKENGEASLDDGKRLALDFFEGSNITLNWPDQYGDAAGVSISLRMMRLLFNLLIIAASGLLRGGELTIRIHQDEDGNKMLDVIATGTSMKWETETEDLLTKPAKLDDISPKTIQLYLTRELSEELQATLTFALLENELSVHAIQKA